MSGIETGADPDHRNDSRHAGSEIARSLPGKTALVTGGSLGIGAAIVRRLAREGVHVALHHSRELDERLGYGEAAAGLLDETGAHQARGFAIDADLAAPGAGRQVFEQALQGLGRVDLVFICASVQKREPFAQLTHDEALRQFHINFWSTIELLQAAQGPMRAQGYGRIVSLGSINQERPDADLAIYAALKAAQHNLIRNLAKDWVADGVTLNTVSPGLVHTPRSDWRRVVPGQWEAFERQANPMRRAAKAEEIAELAVTIASDAMSFMTGENILIDGGAHL